MKVLWICNIILPKISKVLKKPISNGGGWLVGLSDDLSSIKEIELSICFPILDEKNIIKGKIDNINYYGFPQNRFNTLKFNENFTSNFKLILNEVKPDIVHIFGTELSHSLYMFKAFNNPNKTIINIQGLCFAISNHYLNGIPFNYYKKNTFKSFLKRNNLFNEKKSFEKRGKIEIELIKEAKNFIGRTNWDRSLINEVNENAKYYFCNETLRSEFYKNKWNIDNCEKYSIFISQATYPVKGLHFVLTAMPKILKKFPETNLYIAGFDITKKDSLFDKLRFAPYGKYIKSLIKKYNLYNNIKFIGNLNEEEMCKRFLKTHVFVCPSTIENSPNSLGEAMLLGVPSVASYVGGIPDMLEHKKEGFLYQGDAPYMLAYYICKIFEDTDLALKFSENSRKRALITHNRKINLETMIKIYEDIMSK